MKISIHDGVITGYTVNFLEHELRIDIETVTGDIDTVTFDSYLAHYFDHVMAGSILLDIEEADLKTFFAENREEFESHKLFAWPIWYDDVNELEQYLQVNNYKCYIIFASIGLSGYVFAKTFKIKKK